MTPAELRAIGESLYGPVWQAQMARVLPANPRTIRRWLSGDRKIRPLVAERIRSLDSQESMGEASRLAAATEIRHF